MHESFQKIFAWLSCGCLGALWGVNLAPVERFWPHLRSLGAPFGLIWALLGRLLVSFWLSWGVLERLLCPSSPKITKNTRFLNLTCGSGTQVGIQKSKNSTSKTMFFSDAFLTSIFIDILAILYRFWTSNLDVFGLFFGLKAKTSILWKLAFRLDGNSIFQDSKGQKSI